jgi:hypothetical protein
VLPPLEFLIVAILLIFTLNLVAIPQTLISSFCLK